MSSTLAFNFSSIRSGYVEWNTRRRRASVNLATEMGTIYVYQRQLFLGKESLLLTSVHRPGKNTAAIPCGFFAFNLGTEHIEHIHNSVKLSNKRCIRPFILGKKKKKGIMHCTQGLHCFWWCWRSSSRNINSARCPGSTYSPIGYRLKMNILQSEQQYTLLTIARPDVRLAMLRQN